MTMVMQDLNDKSYLLNVMDTPGKKARKKTMDKCGVDLASCFRSH